jgi:G2/mitotic-specific cyclin 3/4
MPSKHQPIHQRHKSTGNLQNMATTGVLKAAAKRTVFADVSNTVKNAVVLKDDAPGMKTNLVMTTKENTLLKKDGFSRPAQRSGVLNIKSTSITSSALLGSSIGAESTSCANASTQSTTKPMVTKQTTSIYEDDDVRKGGLSLAPPSDIGKGVNANFAALSHQPRHYKSQPQLKLQQPLLRRTQSKNLAKAVPQVPVTFDDITETAYEDAVEELYEEEYPAYKSNDDSLGDADIVTDTAATLPTSTDALAPEPRHSELATSTLSEPEEYWDEEEDEDLYDDQGYTTAHSFRSKDLTSGGATTILAPKVTNKIQKELDAAKIFVDANQSQDAIEDEAWDVCMVAEYGDEIFQYMRELEVSAVSLLLGFFFYQ